ncbi:adenylate/guanylate cyclase domain-containing protein [Paraburkholderia fungorum]|jgi:class 3 adenylate cyclase|uniref:Adenylate/guanylate cyclase domain-containing protein n=1 Tax=Paraburkholderia fungorum TaxID=134537 RepID=A0AAP5QHX5_9BURK|nr:adenylate/guanylate cyclase domain-containing protein [Paraburkholderia fungorum]MDT8843801.1 adenylate/guanylate cyclase domain-containing protein [Paraburkholderia fungorum]
MTLKELGKDIATEVEAILSSEFTIDITATAAVPHSDDGAITFPNLDEMRQGCKVIETCVLYIDIRRSTELNLQHRPRLVSKLYSSFVRAMVRCAQQYNGHVRGIIGDRVMVVFDQDKCFTNAVNTAQAMNTVAAHIINKHFKRGEVMCGIGIDHGRMLVTKTGFRRHGIQRHNYRSLVWLGRPANVASKLTDIANKSAVHRSEPAVHVGYDFKTQANWYWQTETVQSFLNNLETNWTSNGPYITHKNPHYAGSFYTTSDAQISPATPPILMTSSVYDGYRKENPAAQSITQSWYRRYEISVPGYNGQIYGGDVIFTPLKPD